MTAAFLMVLALPVDEVTDLVSKLRASTDVVQQHQLAAAIAQAAKPGHVGILYKEIDAGPPVIRPHLIRVLGQIGSKQAVGALRALCQKHEVTSRAEAAYQLKILGEEPGMKLLPEFLAKAQTDEDKREVLNKMHGIHADDGETVQALLRFIRTESQDDIRRAAIYILATHRDTMAAAALKKIASDASDKLRYLAMACVIRTGDSDALEEGLRALEGGGLDPAAMIEILSAVETSKQRSVLPRLRALLEKATDTTLRISLIRVLATLKDEKALPILHKLSEDPDPAVAKAATSAILQVGGRAQTDLLKKMASQEDPLSRLEASKTLLQMDNPEGYAGLKALLEGPHRLSVVDYLGQSRRKESVDLLLPLLDDADAQVKQLSREVLFQILGVLFPYDRFNPSAPADKIRAWWVRNRPK